MILLRQQIGLFKVMKDLFILTLVSFLAVTEYMDDMYFVNLFILLSILVSLYSPRTDFQTCLY